MNREIPGPLWIALVSLGLMVFGKVLAMARVGPLILIDAGLSALLLLGLAKGRKWAYVLTLVGVVWGTATTTMRRGMSTGFTTLMVDCLVLIPVLVCTSWFFPESEKQNRS